MDFEWDGAKAASNRLKHGIPFEAASAVFADPAHVVEPVAGRIQREVRFKAVGRVDGVLLALVYTIRDGVVRVISLRRASRKERKSHGDRSLHA